MHLDAITLCLLVIVDHYKDYNRHIILSYF